MRMFNNKKIIDMFNTCWITPCAENDNVMWSCTECHTQGKFNSFSIHLIQHSAEENLSGYIRLLPLPAGLTCTSFSCCIKAIFQNKWATLTLIQFCLNSKGMVSIYITAAPSEAVLEYWEETGPAQTPQRLKSLVNWKSLKQWELVTMCCTVKARLKGPNILTSFARELNLVD